MRRLAALAAGLCALCVGAGAPAQDLPPEWRMAEGRETLVRDGPRTPRVRIELGWGAIRLRKLLWLAST